MVERPLLFPLGSLIAGLCAAHLLDSIPPAWSLAALLATTLAASLVKSRLPFLLSLSALFFVWGALSLAPFLRPHDQLARYLSERPLLIEAVVDERPEALPSGGGRVTLLVERLYGEEGETPVAEKLALTVKEGRARLFTGDRILFSSKLRRPRNYGLPGEVDYQRKLAYRGIFATAFVKRADELVLVRAGHGPRHELDRLAAALGDFVQRQAPGEEGGVLKALLLGDSGDIPPELNDAYAQSGVNHILSISGFHVGIIFLCVFQLLFFCARRSEFLALHLNLRKSLLIATLPVVICYLFLSGAAPATVRSVLMMVAFTAALLVRREAEPVNSLILASCAILCAAPQTLFEISFQLSFLAFWGLVVLAPPLSAPFAGVGRPAGPAAGGGGGLPRRAGAAALARWFLLLLAASAAAILATLVPVAYYFHRLSFIGLLANLVIVPLMGYGAVVAGFASLPLSFLAPVPAQALLALAAWLVRLSDQLIVYLARAPVFTGYLPTRLDLLLSCLLLCALTFLKARPLRLAAAGVLFCALALRAVPAASGADGLLHLWFLSVGQGDAGLVKLPDGKWMLVDGGGREGEREDLIGSRLLLPALARLGVRRIDYLVLSHEHPDHLLGVLYLARSFEIGEFWESGVPSSSPAYLKLKWLLAARGVPQRVVNGSLAPFPAGGAWVEPLWPPAEELHQPAEEGDPNEDSLVFRLRVGRGSVLFTGDLGSAAEGELLARGTPLGASLLKVGHHGSRYASGDPFLSAVAPEAAVISAGYANPFHLPAPSTLVRLEHHGIAVYRTDLDGTLEAVLRPDGALAFSIWGHFN